MGQVYPRIDDRIRRWIERQQMFFVATAPLAGDGAVNLSPKGHDTLRVLDEHTLAFLDYGGSGIETVAHLRENGRIVIMLCAFEGPPKIYRFHGTGTVITPVDPAFGALAGHFDRARLGVRAIIRVAVSRISDSCGFGVPLFDFRGQRATSPDYLARTGVDEVRRYLGAHNTRSIDGLPGLTATEADAFAGPATADQAPPEA